MSIALGERGVRGIVLDIEGTTTPVSFVYEVLFPYARAAVSHLVTQGGFPQFLLPPVNFDALYAQSVNQQQPAATN